MVSGPADKRVHLTLPTVPVAAPLTLAAVRGAASWRIYYLYDEEGTLHGGVYRSPATSTGLTYFTAVTDDHGTCSGSAMLTGRPSPPTATTPGACPRVRATLRPASGRRPPPS
ncbi:MAG TPA: hypothetical protein PLD23_18815 [Armatimonadota bacterium]|nr:hypothetical protein [Armatimonadota bacterium]